MKNRITTLIFVLLYLSSYSSNDSIKNWSIGLHFSSNINQYSFINEDGSGTYYFKYNERLNFSYGISSIYKMKNKFGIQFSILYSIKGFDKIYNEDEVLATTENSATKTIYKVDYLEFPISCNYLISSNKNINVSIGTGLCYGKQISLSSITYFEDKSRIIEKGKAVDLIFESNQVSVPLNINIDYKITKFTSISINPFVRYDFLKMHQKIIKYNSFGEGIDIKLLFHF